jgi:hypothetical protein
VNAQHAGAGKRRLTALELLLDETPYMKYARVWTQDSGGKGALDVHNLVILSRFPIVASKQLHHDLVPAPQCKLVTAEPGRGDVSAVTWDRPLLHATLAVDGHRLHIINLHLRAPLAAFVPGQKESPLVWRTTAGWAEGFFLATVKRAGQALEARLLVDSLFDLDPDALVVVAGDLNADIWEMPTRILRGDSQDVGAPNLACRSLLPLKAESTGSLPPYSIMYAGRASMVDHLLVSPALHDCFTRAFVANTGLVDEATRATPIAGSHHAPLVAVFRLPGTTPP